jgi:hypothetical protein
MIGCDKATRKQSSYVASNGMAGTAEAVQQKVGTNHYAVDMTAASEGRSDPARAAQRQQGVMTSCQRDHVLLALAKELLCRGTSPASGSGLGRKSDSTQKRWCSVSGRRAFLACKGVFTQLIDLRCDWRGRTYLCVCLARPRKVRSAQ